jgi:hypothetical protein
VRVVILCQHARGTNAHEDESGNHGIPELSSELSDFILHNFS